MNFYTQNPTTGEKLKKYTYLSDSELEKILEQSQIQFENWKLSQMSTRKEYLLNLARELALQKDSLATLMALEMGKPVIEGRAEVDKCVFTCEYFYEVIDKYLADENVIAHYSQTKVIFRPLGPILALMPWNYPIWQLVRFAIPAIASGNVVVLRHSDITAGLAQELEKIFLAAGQKVLFNISVEHNVVTKLISDHRIQGVTFTGSTKVGKIIGELSGKNLKKCVLELGGNDPYLVLNGANLSIAAQVIAKARLVNNGQSCIAAKRVIVVENLVEDFLFLLVNEIKKFKIGNPLNQENNLGPLAHNRIKKNLEGQVSKFLSSQGEIVWQSKNHLFPSESAFYAPQIIYHENNCPVLCEEEVFGPVFNVIAVQNEEQAIRVANFSPWGLGAAVFTQDLEKGLDIIENKLNCGMAVLNDQVKSDPRVPFGGIKDSGYGRELSHYGLLEFVNIKTIGIGK